MTHSELQEEMIAALEEINKLKAENKRLAAKSDKQYEDSMIAHRWFSQQFGDGMNGRDFAVKCPMATEAMRDIHARLIAVAETLESRRGEVFGCTD